tara:strand:+ start:45 stop:1430 length:1386 start_codon:yes stop_codon:yes gene_type:complete
MSPLNCLISVQAKQKLAQMTTFKHPPSIVSIDTSICSGRYDAYVYKYTNIINGKWYVGWHIGMFDGTYWHTSKDKEFIKVFGGSDAVLTLEILSTGLIIDMKNLESKILSDQKVRKNPLSYNGSGSPTGNKEPIDLEKVQEVFEILQERLENGDYEEEDLDIVSLLRSIQVRDKAEEKSHTMRIRDGILETGLEFQTPVLIWEGQDPFGDDKDVRGDGNHTILALLGLKNFNTVKTLRVSREFCEKYNLNLEELRQIGLKMNPRQVVAKRETEDEDVIKQLLGLLEGGTDINPSNTEYGKEVCKNLGYKGKKPAYLCKKAIKIHKDNILAKSGLKRAIYDEDHPDNLKSLNRKAASLNKDRSIVITGNTAQPSKIIRAILESVTDPIYSDCYNVHLVCHHNGNDNNKKIWDSREKSSLEILIKAAFAMMAPVVVEENNGLKHEFPRTFTIHEMDHYQSDIS